MSLDNVVSEDWQKICREALGLKFRSYEGFKIEKAWESYHAHFACVELSKKGSGSKKHKKTKTEKFVVKHYVPIQGSEDTFYWLAHSPDHLFGRELRNLQLIRDLTNYRVNGRPLVPAVLGSYAQNTVVVMQYLEGKSDRKKLIDIVQSIDESPEDSALEKERKRILYEGVRNVARFVGLSNAKADVLKQKNQNYELEADSFRRASQQLFKEYIHRAIYASTPDLLKGSYSPEVVLGYLVEKGRNLDIDSRCADIWNLADAFSSQLVFQHGDLNADHVVEGKFLDLEKFGLGEAPDDISSYLIIGAIGTNAIIENKELPNLLHRYLAFEHAYRCNQGDLGRLSTATNGAFKEYIKKEMGLPEEEYTNFILNFFAHAVRKNIQLIAASNRTGTIIGRSQDIKDLYYKLVSLNFEKCSNPAQAREYFYAMGMLLYDTGIVDFDQSFLKTLRGDSAGSYLRKSSPYALEEELE